MAKRINAVLICIIMIFCSYTAYADKKSDLQSKQNQNQSDINALKDKINKAEQSKTPYLEKKNQLDAQLIEANAKLTKLINQVNALESDIKAKEADIEWLSGEEGKAKEKFVERMQALYEDNSLSYIEILFDSGSISDFFYRLGIIKQLAEYDQEIIGSIVNQKEKTEEIKEQLSADKAQVETVKVQAQTEKDRVAALEAENQQVLNEINNDIASAKAEQALKEKENARIQNEIKKILEEQAKAAAQKNGGTPPLTYSASGMVWPCPGHKQLTSYFGRRFHPVLKIYRTHSGIDIAAPSGANIVAAAAGTVTTSQYSSSYGNYIIINHGGGVMTLYAHMSSRGVSAGASVTAGQSIGKVGSTGISTGPHLHFEVFLNGTRQDPQKYVN